MMNLHLKEFSLNFKGTCRDTMKNAVCEDDARAVRSISRAYSLFEDMKALCEPSSGSGMVSII